jgi:glycosyltransferase involved in cell wall biosynthesis
MSNPQVSIIMPAKNAGRHIAAAIDSVLAQDYTSWELLVADDRSNDNTAELVRLYAARDPRVVYLPLGFGISGGAVGARNHAMKLARGRYMAFLDSDDLWYPNKLSVQLAAMESHSAGLCYSAYKKMDEHGTVGKGVVQVPVSVTYKELLKSNVIGCLTAVYDTHLVGKVLMPEAPRHDLSFWLTILKKKGYYYYEDYATWLRILRRQAPTNQKFAIGIQKPLAIYRVHKGSISHDKWRAARYQWRVYRSVERIPLHSAIYNFCHYALRGYRKYRIA